MADAFSQRGCIRARGLQHQQERCTALHPKSHSANRTQMQRLASRCSCKTLNYWHILLVRIHLHVLTSCRQAWAPHDRHPLGAALQVSGYKRMVPLL